MASNDDSAIKHFQDYLRCKSVHPNPSPGYADVRILFERLAKEVGLHFEVEEYAPGHPTFILTLPGSNPSLQSIILSSHTDVVPVDFEKWTKDPWAAEIIDNKIYGRGSQDMKSVGIQYIEAVARLMTTGWRPVRTLHLLYVPDEEVGGNRGMKLFLTSERVKAMNPALVLDEGLASPSDKYSVFYGERKIWWIRVTATGAAGHGSRFIEGTAVGKIVKVINKMLEHREAQKAELDRTCGCGKQLGVGICS